MNLEKTIVSLCATLSLLSISPITFAEGDSPPSDSPMAERCHNNPEKCKKMKEHMENLCKGHPLRCEEMKKSRDEIRKACENDPETCKKKRREMRGEHHRRMKEKCKQNPDQCNALKKHHKQYEHHEPDHEGTVNHLK